jgi:hypothetical protein
MDQFGSANDLSATYAAASPILGSRRGARLAHQAGAVPSFGSERSRGVRPIVVKPLLFSLRGRL